MIKGVSFLGQLMLKRSFSKVAKTSNRPVTTTKMSTDYTNWSKEDLISKINQLESNSSTTFNGETSSQRSIKPVKKQKKKEFDWSKQNMRFVAFKFAYLGWNYNGLALQLEPTPLPTIEEVFLKALAKVKLIKEPIEEVKFSRCGRTDKGVSAMNQVISINVRSNITLENQSNPEFDDLEIDYISVLNANLPSDIKVHSICLRPPPDFDARFSCLSRHYRYIFRKQDLDIELMNQGAKLYQGIHDFRNFCKLDGSKQITNFVREIYQSQIIHLHQDYYCFDLKGSAFLWHQVRCMVAILFTIGQGLESPSIITDLMDTNKFPTKPQYEMAHDIPLVLYDCEFPSMEWKSTDDEYRLHRVIQGFTRMQYDLQLKTQMSQIMEDTLFKNQDPTTTTTKILKTMNNGDGVGRSYNKYMPISERERTESYEVLNLRWMEKKGYRREQEKLNKE
ncbi:tRNA pseudouridine(38-40) synthase [Candida albicans Ca529L]|nr:tRNA pseudouridine(38-40) synthase [Candida albicans Ca529L]